MYSALKKKHTVLLLYLHNKSDNRNFATDQYNSFLYSSQIFDISQCLDNVIHRNENYYIHSIKQRVSLNF